MNIDFRTNSFTNVARTPDDCDKNETEGLKEKSPLKFYDIKGNTFKNTLIPKETAI